jgi:hypothetical protein
MTYATQKLTTRESPVHGLGCFATADIWPWEMVGVFEGEWLTLPLGPDGQPVYPPEVDPRYCIDVALTTVAGQRSCIVLNPIPMGLVFATPLDRINHSFTPNCKVVGLAVMAAEPIPAGTELTIDYTTLDCTEFELHEVAA